jgi:hypothetical protein
MFDGGTEVVGNTSGPNWVVGQGFEARKEKLTRLTRESRRGIEEQRVEETEMQEGAEEREGWRKERDGERSGVEERVGEIGPISVLFDPDIDPCTRLVAGCAFALA